MIDTADVEKRAELTRVQAIEIGTTIGGITIASPADIEIIAHRLARAKVAVPPHVRDNPGVAFALCLQALEWRMPIMSVINKSYVVNNKGVERIAYESQLVHAIIERNAPIKGRLRSQIIGEGDERRCKVWATFKGEKSPHEYTSETLGSLREARGRNKEKGDVLKGSPLWESQPEVQLFYSASRTWARMFAPDVILGAYTPEDPWYSDEMKDVTPALDGLAQRLKDARKAHTEDRGFDVEHVAKVIEGDATEAKDENDASSQRDGHETGIEGRPMGADNRPIGDRDQKGRSAGGEEHKSVRASPAGQRAARKEDTQTAGLFDDRPKQAPSQKGKR
jgi:RecT family